MVGKSGLQIQVEVEEQIRKLQFLQLQPQPEIPQPLQQLQPPLLPPLLPPPPPPSPPSPPVMLRSKRRRMQQRFAERSQRSKSWWYDWPPLAEGRFLIGPRLGAGGSAKVRLSFFMLNVYSNNRATDADIYRRGFSRLQVHVGFDTSKHEKVALKVLDADATWEIKRECFIASDRTFADIRAHPLLVAPQCAIQGCEETNGRCVIVLNLQRGPDVRIMFSEPMRLSVFIQACHDLLTAVDFLHGKGLVHRCVGKNVMSALSLHLASDVYCVLRNCETATCEISQRHQTR